MDGGEAGGNDVSEIAGDVKKRGGANERLVRSGDAGNAGAEARAENAKRTVAAHIEPAEAAARVANRLPIGLKSEADVGSDDVVSARMAGHGAFIVIRQAEAQSRNTETIQPAADVDVRGIIGVPLRQNDDRGAVLARIRWE